MTNARQHQAEQLEERLALKITSRLSDASDAVPHDIGERLRHARMQAVARRKRPAVQAAPVLLSAGHNSLTLGGSGQEPRWWQRMAVVLPALALLIGLVAIDGAQSDNAAQEMAQLDAALLIDDLPPAAYTDPGFLQFLRSNRDPSR